MNLVNRKHLIKIVTSNLMIKLRMSEVTPRRRSTCIRIDDTRQELRWIVCAWILRCEFSFIGYIKFLSLCSVIRKGLDLSFIKCNLFFLKIKYIYLSKYLIFTSTEYLLPNFCFYPTVFIQILTDLINLLTETYS